MKQVVTCSQMKALDGNTISQIGLPSCVLMERAALSVTGAIESHLDEMKSEGKILVVCGCGNNGGDGIAIARMLYLHGRNAAYYIVGNPERMTQETRQQYLVAQKYGIPEVNNPEWDEYTIIVDAIFGVGLTRHVDGHFAEVIRSMNAASAWKVAVDIPSGIDGDNGKELGIAFRADLTVTFAFRKKGLCFYPGRMYAGEILVTDIGIYESESVPVAAWHLEKEDLRELPKRVPSGNKGTFGKVLVVAGTSGMCGAAFLSAAGALAGGAGMVKIQTVEENRIPLQTLLPEAMVSCVFEEEENRRSLNWCDVIVIGPGLGVSGESRERAEWFLKNASSEGKRIILDADGLNLLSLHPQWKAYLNERVIVTPHLGEMGRLCGKTIRDLQDCLEETALAYAKETKAICVLKDACTVVADPTGTTYLNLAGNAGMATAGSGDVLSGVLAAVCCQYLNEADGAADYGKQAAFGVLLHALAGDLASDMVGMHGMTARDLIKMIPQVRKSL